MTLKTLWIFIKKYTTKTYSFLVIDAAIASKKQTEKQVAAIKSLDLFNKKDGLKQIEAIFS